MRLVTINTEVPLIVNVLYIQLTPNDPIIRFQRIPIFPASALSFWIF